MSPQNVYMIYSLTNFYHAAIIMLSANALCFIYLTYLY